jgi:hypothetical protein
MMLMEGHGAVHISSDLPTVSLLAILCTNPCNLWLVPTKGNLSIGLVPHSKMSNPWMVVKLGGNVQQELMA